MLVCRMDEGLYGGPKSGVPPKFVVVWAGLNAFRGPRRGISLELRGVGGPGTYL